MILRALARLAVWGHALLAIGAYVMLGLHRMPYPLELDCIEGVMMDHVARLADGKPMYVEPTLHYIPLAYMPLFATVSSLLARIWGPEFWEPRLVAFSASLLLSTLMAVIVFAETRRPTLAIAAPGVFLMGFAFNGAAYDIARPDSLMLLFTFAGLATLRFTRGIPGALGAAVLLALGFFTKQHSILFSIGALAYLVFHDRRRALPFGVAIVVLTAGTYAVLTAWLGEWFRVFTWSVPRGWSQFAPVRIEAYLGKNLFGTLGVLSVGSVLSLGSAERPNARVALWYWTGLAAVGTGLMATLDPYAYHHLFMPSMAGVCVLGPIALDRLARQLDAGGSSSRGLGTAAVYVVLFAQFVPLLYPIHSLKPHPRAREAHSAFIEYLKKLPADVLIPYHGWYDHQSGREGSLQIIPFEDIGRSRGNALVRKDPKYLEHMLAPLKSGPNRPWLVMDEPLEQVNEPWPTLVGSYELADTLGWITEALRPVAGNRFAPHYLYRPIEPGAAAAAGEPSAP
ncbi:MAG: hypothetical protein U0704_01640 [Candidatus Eisenbacteria bacterium]